MRNLTKRRPKELVRSEELSRHFQVNEREARVSYLESLGFTSSPGQWTWKRGPDRAYVVNPERGLIFVDVYLKV